MHTVTANRQIGERLALARASSGLTLKKLGEKCGYSLTGLNSVERGHDTPSARMLLAVAEALGICPVWLQTGRGEMISAEANAKRLADRAQAFIQQLEKQATSDDLNDPNSPISKAIGQLRAGLSTLEEYKGLLKFRAAMKEKRKQPVAA